MPRSETYATKQKNTIINVIKTKEEAFTVKEIYKALKEKVGLTTIYRLTAKLEKEGKIKKIIDKDGKTYYQYLKSCDKENHFYLKCDKCARMIHIDCDCIDELYNHILNNHKFKLSKTNVIINGLCKECIGEIK